MWYHYYIPFFFCFRDLPLCKLLQNHINGKLNNKLLPKVLPSLLPRPEILFSALPPSVLGHQSR